VLEGGKVVIIVVLEPLPYIFEVRYGLDCGVVDREGGGKDGGALEA